MTRYDKLVRDRIPDIIRAKGETAVVRLASEQEYATKLKEKLSEEVTEYLESGSPEELADIMEVVHALATLTGHGPADVERLRAEKADARGGFSKRIILEES